MAGRQAGAVRYSSDARAQAYVEDGGAEVQQARGAWRRICGAALYR